MTADIALNLAQLPLIWPQAAGKPRPFPGDPFYLPPPGWQSAPPGTVLHRREAQVALLGLLPLRCQAQQLLYRSTDHAGAPETTVTTVIVPNRATDDSPLLAYQCAIDAVASRCFPSYALLRGSTGLVPLNPQIELLVMAAALDRGWVVTVSDHEGPHGLLVAPRQPGYHVLDGIRATLALAGTHGMPALSERTLIGLMGYSGGALASGWTAELAATYAPELNIVGAALGGTVARPDVLVQQLNGGAFGGLTIVALASLRKIYPAVEEAFQRHMSPKGFAKLAKAAQATTIEAGARYAFTNLGKYIDLPLAELLEQPEMVKVMHDGRLGTAAPAFPMYLYHGVHDEIPSVSHTDRLVEIYRAGGTPITYRRDRLSEHVSLVVTGQPAAIDWLADRFAGTPLPAEFDAATVSSTLFTRRALRGLGRWIAAIVRLLAGRL